MLFRRALATVIGALGATTLLVVATDEATSTIGTRIARLSALAPLVIAISVLGVSSLAKARGELSALSALGLPPWRAARGAVLAGLVMAGVAMLALLSPFADTASLFPVVHAPLGWVIDGLGTSARAPGIVVLPDGSLTLVAAGAERARVTPGAFAALACIAPVALVVPHWAVTPMSPRLRVASMALTAAVAITALHLVAAARLMSGWSACAVLPLVAATALSRVAV
jgi:hypothetical protein